VSTRKAIHTEADGKGNEQQPNLGTEGKESKPARREATVSILRESAVQEKPIAGDKKYLGRARERTSLEKKKDFRENTRGKDGLRTLTREIGNKKTPKNKNRMPR